MGTLKFFPFQSSIQPGFWNSLANKKLEELKLSETPVPIVGSFTHTDSPRAGLSPRLSVDWDGLEATQQPSPWNRFNVRGEVLLINTIEAFKARDKAAYINSIGEEVWKGIVSGEFWSYPSLLCRFSVLMYGDLKKFQFVYWFNFPAFNLPEDISLVSCDRLGESLPAALASRLAAKSSQFTAEHPDSIYSLVSIENDEVVFKPFSSVQHLDLDNTSSRNLLCVVDPCSAVDHPGWPVRNLVIALAATDPRILNSLEVLCLRVSSKDGVLDAAHSLILKIKFGGEKLLSMPAVVGWEKNEKGQLAPRSVNMRASMDPVKIAESSVDLNLKLMKWRLVPEINLNLLKDTKFLLLGSGTLGCGVARSLLGWGARNITFVDNAKVSFSNPVRQSLYEFSDCLDGGANKAQAAAKKLTAIFPGVKAEGFDISIPMPGHPVSESTEAKVRAAHDSLKALISEHQVVFLLMDSRESRWLPTVMAACHPDKLVINAALGFDTYLVMRHGVRTLDSQPGTDQIPGLISGEKLGCYFCNDVVAPGDSLSDRTLDMQCTVTRPGASAVAAALAVELAVSCLQHQLGAAAPAVLDAAAAPEGAADSILGLIPHTIRGSLHSFNQYLPTGPSFSQCTACCPKIIQMYKSDGFELVKRVGEAPRILEDITGLTELLNDSNIMDSVIGLDDDDSFSITSD